MKVELGTIIPTNVENRSESMGGGVAILIAGVLGSNSYPSGNPTQISVKGNLSVLLAFPSMT
jgi:hypothetical protein